MALTPGTRLGPYEILAPIGAGGMGEVYKASDTRLDRIVAIKLLPPEATRNADCVRRFIQEAKAASALNHPNIITVHDIGERDNERFLVMEMVSGKPLRSMTGAPNSVATMLPWCAQMAKALAAAHAAGITHRDIKPENIMVRDDGYVKVLDFGLARLAPAHLSEDDATVAQQTMPGHVMGTLKYMSPEQARGAAAGPPSDIFSLGLVFYELASGKYPFKAETMVGYLHALIVQELPPVTKSNPEIPAAFEALISRMLAKEAAKRPTASEVNEALAAIEQGELVEHLIGGLRKANLETAGDKHSVPGASGAETGSSASMAQSIAVLPFANMSPDPEQVYFGDGLAEEIINLLAHISGLKVIARTSAFAFRGKEQDIRGIAEALGVRTVLEGSVRRSGSRIRVTAQLINAADGSHLWSERYDREMTDVFAIQDEIGQAISVALQLQLAPHARTVNIEAYQKYLRGRHYMMRGTPQSTEKGKEYFEQALAIDPNYAAAHTALAEYYHVLWILGLRPVGDTAILMKSAAERALAIDPTNGEAHSLLAAMAAGLDYDWKAAEAHQRNALVSQPVGSLVRFRYVAFYLFPLGRFADAMEQSRLALDTDPLSTPVHYGMTLCMNHAKRFRETIEYARRGLEIDANFYWVWLMLGYAQLYAGLEQEAIISLQRVVELAPWWHVGVGSLAAAYHKCADHERGQEWARKVRDLHGRTYGAAIYYAATGDLDAMFDALDEAYRRRDVLLLHIHGLPFFDPYRADPRFQALRLKMHLA